MERATVEKVIAYIHNNPIRRELSVVPEEFPFSSAPAYSSGVEDGLVSFWQGD
jgi:hypothetical protein